MPLKSNAKSANGETSPRRVYVRQYAYWWSFPLDAWIDFCLRAYVDLMHGSGEGYSLPLSREIKAPPSRAVFVPVRGGRDVMAHTGYRVAEPLDWDEDSFLEELAALGYYVCPDCVGPNGLPVHLAFGEGWYLASGTHVQYATCSSCETKYVSMDGRAAEPAA